MTKAFTGEPEPPVLDVDNLSVSTSVLQHDPFGGDPCTMPHSSTTVLQPPARPELELSHERHAKRMADLGEPIQEPFDR